VFSYFRSGVLVTESGVPSSAGTTHARIYVDMQGGHKTGVAVFNPGDGPVSLTASAFAMDGTTPAGAGSWRKTLDGKGHTAGFAEDFISNLPAEFSGVLDISAANPFVPVTLRALNNGRDQIYTTFPVADLSRPAPPQVVFPQIADGGGQYQTQFIFLGTSGEAAGLLTFYADDGLPIALGKALHK